MKSRFVSIVVAVTILIAILFTVSFYLKLAPTYDLASPTSPAKVSGPYCTSVTLEVRPDEQNADIVHLFGNANCNGGFVERVLFVVINDSGNSETLFVDYDRHSSLEVKLNPRWKAIVFQAIPLGGDEDDTFTSDAVLLPS